MAMVDVIEVSALDGEVMLALHGPGILGWVVMERELEGCYRRGVRFQAWDALEGPVAALGCRDTLARTRRRPQELRVGPWLTTNQEMRPQYHHKEWILPAP